MPDGSTTGDYVSAAAFRALQRRVAELERVADRNRRAREMEHQMGRAGIASNEPPLDMQPAIEAISPILRRSISFDVTLAVPCGAGRSRR